MIEILNKLCLTKKNASFYTNTGETNKFHYGSILAVNSNEVAINLISPDGDFDGILVKPTDSIYRIQVDSQYDIKMNNICSDISDNTFTECIDNTNIKESLLYIGLKTQKIVSLELLNSGINDVVGIIKKLENGACKVQIIDEYGMEDGISYIFTNDITEVCYASADENRILKLWKINNK